ncbi:MAG: FAD-binding and (Fe-S)-binding domain-containing protein [Chloroflexota bacterium]
MSLSPDFLHELKKHFAGDIRLDAASRVLYSTDASIYQIEPLGVAIPRTQEDLHAAVELAAKVRVPILPRGAGSSLAGQAIGEALILDCSRWLDSIVAINPEERTAIVEPGVVLADLNRAASKYGLQFGPDPASAERATMGGVIGNNATGAHSILYGMAADHLLEADVILSDGSLAKFGEWVMEDGGWRMEGGNHDPLTLIYDSIDQIRTKYSDAIEQHFPKSWRNSAGYRLNYLLPFSHSTPPFWEGDYPSIHPSSFSLHPSILAGSEGTLAVIRRVKLNLVPKPKHTILGVLAYDSIPAACDDVPRLLEFHPSAVELIPQMILRLARGVPAYARQMGWLEGDPSAILVVEFSGDRPEVLKETVLRLRSPDGSLRSAQRRDDLFYIAESPEDQPRIWNIRKVGLGILDSRPQSARPVAFIEDCAIPVERLGGFVREVERIIKAHGTEGGIYAHASAGCLHIRPILDLRSGEGMRSLRSIAEQVLALTLQLGGSMSSEHGDGIARAEWLKQTYGEEVTEAMRLLKCAADPHGILNPHKMFDAPPMDSHLRYGTEYAAQAWMPALDFRRNGGLQTAIEQCNGQGVCRKTTGVMCPSYQATREEANSTRGRANLLRAMISLNVERSTFNAQQSDAVFQSLDLCLACKGCKSECPSSVDMAKLKFEFMHEYYKTHRRLLRDYLFGYFHITARVLSVFAPLVNWATDIPFVKQLAATILQITPHRPFPKFNWKRAKVVRTLAPHASAGVGNPQNTVGCHPAPQVIFLSDAFSRYIEPQVEQAAFDVLAACGYQVLVLPVVGAGAGLVSKSFFESAQRHARSVLAVLTRLDPEGVLPVVGIEPPEVYCLKNDYADLLPSHAEETASLSARTWLLDEFLLRSDAFNNLRVANITNHISSKSIQSKIKLQPHCHQRAEAPAADGLPIGSAATLSLLQSLGLDVEMLDAGCCGMAGTFGYEAEHYELSMKVGERVFKMIRVQGTESSGPTRPFGTSSPNSKSLGRDGEGLVCSGAACRMQVTQGTGNEARHPLELVAECIRSSAPTD